MSEHVYLEAAKALVRPAEKLELKPYYCPAGKLTIGYGHNLEAKGISKRVAEILLDEDVREAAEDLQRFAFWPYLNDARKAVLVDFHLNTGPGTFRKFKRMIAALLAANYAEAAIQMLDSDGYGRSKHAGLRKRAQRNAEILRTGEIGKVTP